MSLLTRGLGPNSKLLTGGFGPPPPAEELDDTIPYHPGRRSGLYDKLAENIYVKKYSTLVELVSVNGKRVDNPKKIRTEIDHDERDSYRVVLNEENVSIKKTNPKEGILINVLQVFKR